MITVALAGNPNCGKTTLFNAFTGSRQHVGNWPGVTVEKKEGQYKYEGALYNVVDLPGTYSLGAYSEDEVVARDYILQSNPDVVVNVVDATNIERNLYLTTQLIEMGAKVIIALNIIDEADKRGIDIDIDLLSKKLGVPIVATVASREKGIHELKAKIHEIHGKKVFEGKRMTYGVVLDSALLELRKALEEGCVALDYPPDWTALKILERDDYILKNIKRKNPEVADRAEVIAERVTLSEGMDPEMIIVDKRYEFIGSAIKKAVKRPRIRVETMSDKIDKILTHKWFGLPIFAMVMLIIYQLTFVVGENILGEAVAGLMENMGTATGNILHSIGVPDILVVFVEGGIFGGLGAVLEFLPLIMVLYFLLGLLEDSGYMARAAYVMDRIMVSLGLHGKTFISMLIGIGCNVPGIMATRTLESKKDRMIAMLINPFVSCGARLPIYLVFTAAFFPKNGGLVLFAIYATGFLVALLMGKIFSKTLFRGETSHFIMELPPYRIPTLRGVVYHMWDKVGGFLKKAGTIIFAVVTMLWVLSVIPYGVEPYSEASVLGQIGSFISPIFKPAGFGTWQASVGLFAGIVAKEAVVATLGMVYAGVEGGQGLITAIQQVFTPLSATSFMVMTLLYTPCAAVIGTVKRETGSIKWALFMATYTFAVGWIGAVAVFQIGRLFGLS